MGRSASSARAATLAGTAFLALLVLLQFAPLVSCLDTCIVDHVELRGQPLGKLELPDARLNTWILAWVQHSLLTDPAGLFDANIFYPARHTLTQSEHLLTMAFLALPLRAVTDNAMAIHQIALMLSSLLLGVTTAALVRWLGGSRFASLVAGAAAIGMPWRYAEPAHIQLMNVQWLPWIWLLMGKVVADENRSRAAAWLSLALSLQVMSSFYLSYYTALSCAVVGLVLLARNGFQWRTLTALGAACVPPTLLLAAIGIPYLRWSADSGFRSLAQLFDSATIPEVLSVTAPKLVFDGIRPLPFPVNYEVPLAVAVLGAIGLGVGWRRRHQTGARRRGDFLLALSLAIVAAFVMAMGRTVEIGNAAIPLPSHWAALVIPGFENLRNPLRWAIVISVAFPVLAGLGVAALEERTHGAARIGLGVAIVAGLGLTFPLTPLPARPVWEGQEARLAGWRALAELPPGPVIEQPWPLQDQRDFDLATQYMLGSTLHWRPLTNGMSGYLPPSYALLRQIADGLPSSPALARVQSLADIRWLLVHDELLTPARGRRYEAAETKGTIRLAWSDATTRIYEVPDWESGGRYRDAFASHAPRATTLAGLPRTPLTPTEARGELAAGFRGAFHYLGQRRLPRHVMLRIHNQSTRDWPGLDAQTEGLVMLRYAFEGGAERWTSIAALGADLPAGRSTALRVPVLPPIQAGRYRLVLDLVQRRGDEHVPLPIAPVALDVLVRRGQDAPDEGLPGASPGA